MNALLWKIPDVHGMAAPPSHWRRSQHDDARADGESLRAVHSFASTRVRHSVAPALQPKLNISSPGDSAELEADRVADAVMSMPASLVGVEQQENTAVQCKCAGCAEEDRSLARVAEDGEEEVARMEDEEEVARMEDEEEVARMEDEEEVTRMEDEEEVARMEDDEEVARMEDDEDSALQAKAHASGAPRVTPELESQIHALHSTGSPLSRDTRSYFEPRMGTDLSQVRIQTDSRANRVARQLNARAFTVGNHITFGAGQYQPDSSQGKRLLAHELAHVIQQGGAERHTDKRER